ncbi:cointegrate resolution protein T [Pseudomonas sp. BN414]|nr:cointegrate resolution protein T [Pseudomonas sp. BN414]MDH4580800.1 cointegrate resolution protein T [Pseudomonas sp. BN415]
MPASQTSVRPAKSPKFECWYSCTSILHVTPRNRRSDSAMARSGINKALVQKARDALLARGVRPSIDAVRIELGNTGSKSTIQRYLKELDTPPVANGPGLSEEITSFISGLSDRLRQAAETSVAAEREAVARQQQEYRSHRQFSAERIEQLRADNDQLRLQLDSLNTDCGLLRSQLHSNEVDRTRLLEAQTGLQQLLDERAAQLRSLEDKHQHARDALTHFREASQVQRAQELQRHDGQLQHLQTEIRTLQHTLSIRLDELATLNRDNERLMAASSEQVKQQRLLTQELQKQRATINTLQQDLINRQTERAALEERLMQKQAELALMQQHGEQQREQLVQLQKHVLKHSIAADNPAIEASSKSTKSSTMDSG